LKGQGNRRGGGDKKKEEEDEDLSLREGGRGTGRGEPTALAKRGKEKKIRFCRRGGKKGSILSPLGREDLRPTRGRGKLKHPVGGEETGLNTSGEGGGIRQRLPSSEWRKGGQLIYVTIKKGREKESLSKGKGEGGKWLAGSPDW